LLLIMVTFVAAREDQVCHFPLNPLGVLLVFARGAFGPSLPHSVFFFFSNTTRFTHLYLLIPPGSCVRYIDVLFLLFPPLLLFLFSNPPPRRVAQAGTPTIVYPPPRTPPGEGALQRPTPYCLVRPCLCRFFLRTFSLLAHFHNGPTQSILPLGEQNWPPVVVPCTSSLWIVARAPGPRTLVIHIASPPVHCFPQRLRPVHPPPSLFSVGLAPILLWFSTPLSFLVEGSCRPPPESGFPRHPPRGTWSLP